MTANGHFISGGLPADLVVMILLWYSGSAKKVRIEEDPRKQAEVVCIYYEVKLTTELSNYGFFSWT